MSKQPNNLQHHKNSNLFCILSYIKYCNNLERGKLDKRVLYATITTIHSLSL